MKKKVILAILLIFATVLAGCNFTKTSQPSPIEKFLEDNQIPYRNTEIVDDTLTVRILTDAKKGDTCPLEVQKAYYKVYEAAYAGVILGDYHGLHFEAVDDIGATIFDWEDKDVKSEEPDVVNFFEPDPRANTYTDKEIKEKVQELVSEYDFTIDEIKLEQLGELVGKKLVLTLSYDYSTSFTTLEQLHDKLFEFAISSNSLSSSNITVNNRKGICMYYVNEYFRKGEFSVWIHPYMEEQFLAEKAPPSE